MAYATLIDTNLNLAFNLLKDLAQSGTLVKANNIAFDFGTGAATQSATQIPVKFIVVEEKRDHKETSPLIKSILLKAKVVGILTTNDRLNIGSEVWKLAHVVNSDGYITQAEIVREV